MKTCKLCGKQIKFIDHLKGEIVPVDEVSKTILVPIPGCMGGPIYKYVSGFPLHHGTCVQAENFKGASNFLNAVLNGV